MNKILIKLCGIILCLAFTLGVSVLAICGVFDVPEQIILSQDKEQTFHFGLPISLNFKTNNENIFTLNGLSPDEKKLDLNGPIVLKGNQEGDALISVGIFGITLKEVTVSSRTQRYLIPGGQSIGVTLYTKGALVVGSGEITDEMGNAVNPARQAGLLPGDVIEKVNGKIVENSDHLSDLVGTNTGKPVNVTVRREDKTLELTIYPVKDIVDNVFRIGVWVRDSTAGVGTLTYYDEMNNSFGGLGHAVIDVDTQQLLSLKNGEIIESSVLEIDKGQSGRPGELHGSFSFVNKRLGSIRLNTEFGIYGTLYDKNFIQGKPLPIGLQQDVQYGKASILTTVDNQGIQEYECEIIKINPQQFPSQKGMVIKITDPDLLNKTGGIVQGMSGSPIIQDGRIIGAVTHVFLNSPDKGYGMFIEWMLKCSDRLN